MLWQIIIILILCIFIYLLINRRKKVQVVISRYNEDVSWLSKPPYNKYPIILYEKGPSRHLNCLLPDCERVLLPNVGRCDHTYLYYIITHYDCLPDKVIFIPGSIRLPHKTSAVNYLFDIIEDDDALSGHFKRQADYDLKSGIYDFMLDNWSASDPENTRINNETELQKSAIRPFGKWFEHHFSKEKQIYGFWYMGIFAATRDRIQRHPIEVYQRLIREVETHSNPEVGHYIERTWFSLFGDSK